MVKTRRINMFNVLKNFLEEERLESATVVPLAVESEDWDQILSIFPYPKYETKSTSEGIILDTSYWMYDRKIPVRFWGFLDKSIRVIYLVSEAGKTAFAKTVGNEVERESGIYHLIIGSKKLSGIKDWILQQYPEAEILEFTARRTEWEREDCEIRPRCWKSMDYRGADATQMLKEMEYYHGVLPRSIVFRVTSMDKLEIDFRGIFKSITGDFNTFFEIMKKSLKEPLEVRSATVESRQEVIPFEMPKGEINTLRTIPLIFQFGDKWGIKEGSTFLKVMKKLRISEEDRTEEGGFTAFDVNMQTGSFLLSATIIDEKKGGIFTIDADENEMVIIPKYKAAFDSLLRFYQFFIENIDHETKCVVEHGRL